MPSKSLGAAVSDVATLEPDPVLLRGLPRLAGVDDELSGGGDRECHLGLSAEEVDEAAADIAGVASHPSPSRTEGGVS